MYIKDGERGTREDGTGDFGGIVGREGGEKWRGVAVARRRSGGRRMTDTK